MRDGIDERDGDEGMLWRNGAREGFDEEGLCERKSDDPSWLCGHGPHMSTHIHTPRASCEEFGDGHAPVLCPAAGHDDGRLDPSAQTLRPDQHTLGFALRSLSLSLRCKWRYSAQPTNFCIGIESQRSNFPSRAHFEFCGPTSNPAPPPSTPRRSGPRRARPFQTSCHHESCLHCYPLALAVRLHNLQPTLGRAHGECTHAQANESYNDWVQGIQYQCRARPKTPPDEQRGSFRPPPALTDLHPACPAP